MIVVLIVTELVILSRFFSVGKARFHICFQAKIQLYSDTFNSNSR